MNSWLCIWFRLALLVVLMCPLEYYAQPAPGEKMPVRLSSADAPEYLAGVELAYAVRKGYLARAQKALAAAPSLLAEAKARQMVLVLAAQEGHPGIVEWLLLVGNSIFRGIGSGRGLRGGCWVETESDPCSPPTLKSA